jgi:glutamate synthase (NADPH/NADH) large chain
MPSIPSVRVGANVVKQLREGINMDAVKVAASELKGAISRARARKAVPPAGWLNGRPPAQGLFDPAREHDACGVGIIADMSNAKRHDIIEKGLKILLNLRHRGAVGADPKLGDGCGIMVQIPHRFFLEECAKLGFKLPEPGHYAVGHFFLPQDEEAARLCREVIEKTIADEGQVLLGLREPPVDNSDLGESVRPTEPLHLQAFIGRGKGIASDEEFERRLYILRKQISGTVYNMKENNLRAQGFYPVSISCRTAVYKGMVLASQHRAY